jgi:hypothetical protein
MSDHHFVQPCQAFCRIANIDTKTSAAPTLLL